jgi:hypothetical protein
MGQPRKPGVAHESAAERKMRDQEVLRANRELAAYFQGQRTEREARAALRIIKAFIREREHRDTKSRPPLPHADVVKTPKAATNRQTGEPPRRKPRRTPREQASTRVTASAEPQAHQDSPPVSESD